MNGNSGMTIQIPSIRFASNSLKIEPNMLINRVLFVKKRNFFSRIKRIYSFSMGFMGIFRPLADQFQWTQKKTYGRNVVKFNIQIRGHKRFPFSIKEHFNAVTYMQSWNFHTQSARTTLTVHTLSLCTAHNSYILYVRRTQLKRQKTTQVALRWWHIEQWNTPITSNIFNLKIETQNQ